jgi:Holliday junction resolvase RusA-like endonuclease
LNKFVIQDKLPTLNEYSNAERTNRFKAAKLKKEAEELIGWHIKTSGIKPIKEPIILVIHWQVPKTCRFDPDNIVFAKKFILDALQKTGIIQNDNKKYIKGFSDHLLYEGKEYRTEVTLLKVD